MASGSQFGRYAVIISFVYVAVRWGLPVRLLTGLEAWGVSKPKKDGEDAKSPSVKPDRKRSSKHDSVAKKAVKQELTAPGAESLLCRSLTAEDIRSADYYSFVEVLVTALVVLVGVTAIDIFQALVQRSAMSFFPALMATLAVPIGYWTLVQVDVLSRTTPAADCWYLAGIASITLLVASLGLTYVPQRVLDFDVKGAAEDAGRGLSLLLQQRIPGLDEDALSISPAWLTALLALLASATAALVSSAGLRMAKAYELAVRAPQGAAEIAAAPYAQQALLHCSVALPVLTCLLWVTPIFQEILQWQHGTMRWLRMGASLSTAVCQLAAFRPLLQAHLHSAMVQWWTNRNAGRNLQASSTQMMTNIINARVQFITAILCKVSVEFLAPGLLLLAWSILLVGVQSDTQSSTAEQHAVHSLWGARRLWELVGGFMAWWTCACWAGSTCFTVLLFRLGFLVS